MVNELESTLEWTQGEEIVNSGIGSHTPCFLWIRHQSSAVPVTAALLQGSNINVCCVGTGTAWVAPVQANYVCIF
jgi:hypothetical protein